MDKHYTYLLINFLTVLFPVLLSFDSRVRFYRSWKYLLPALLLSGLVFLLWDSVFTIKGVWSFNDSYITGIRILYLPLEEVLFFITVPFACVFIYSCLNYYVQRDILAPVSQWITLFLTVLSLFMLVVFYDRLYTAVTFGLLFVVIVYAGYVRKAAFLSRFYLAFIVSLIPFYLVNGLLTSLPVVLYNDSENMGLRVGTIPVEDHFYSLSLLVLNVLLFEAFKRATGKRDSRTVQIS